MALAWRKDNVLAWIIDGWATTDQRAGVDGSVVSVDKLFCRMMGVRRKICICNALYDLCSGRVVMAEVHES